VDPEGYRLSQAAERTIALERLLRSHGIIVQTGTHLETMALNVFDALYLRESSTSDESADIREPIKHLIGLNELACLILGVQQHPEFFKLVPFLRLLNEGMSIQNMPSPVIDQATNKVFELVAAVLALHCGTDLELDDKSAKGRNPDVLITIRGRRWGIACKALHGTNPEGFIVHLEKAIDQIEKSPAETGVVFFTIKNLIDQAKYWAITNPENVAAGEAPLFSAFLDPGQPFEMLAADANSVGNALKSYLPPGYLESAFAGKKALPGFLVWANVATAVVFNGLPVPTSARIMALQYVNPIEENDRGVLDCLHEAAYAGDKI
jgi:hypothetical protein